MSEPEHVPYKYTDELEPVKDEEDLPLPRYGVPSWKDIARMLEARQRKA